MTTEETQPSHDTTLDEDTRKLAAALREADIDVDDAVDALTERVAKADNGHEDEQPATETETETGGARFSRRAALGLLGLGALGGVGTAATFPTIAAGQTANLGPGTLSIGTVNTDTLGGGVAAGNTITSLVGEGLYVDASNRLSATAGSTLDLDTRWTYPRAELLQTTNGEVIVDVLYSQIDEALSVRRMTSWLSETSNEVTNLQWRVYDGFSAVGSDNYGVDVVRWNGNERFQNEQNYMTTTAGNPAVVTYQNTSGSDYTGSAAFQFTREVV